MKDDKKKVKTNKKTNNKPAAKKNNKNTGKTNYNRNNKKVNNKNNYVKKNNVKKVVKKEEKKVEKEEVKVTPEVKETTKVKTTNENRTNFISYLVVLLAIVLVIICIVCSKSNSSHAYVNVDGELKEVKLVDGQLTEYPDVVEKDDYEFVEWSVNDETYTLGMKLEDDAVIEAKYVRLYNVRYVFNNGLADEVVTVREGDLADYMVPYLEGYVFVGWYAEDDFYDFEQPIVSDLTLEAIYAEDTGE